MGESWNALAHIRQAVTFLVIHQKHRKSFREITEDLCGALSVQQLYRISTMYWDDRCVAAAAVQGARAGLGGGDEATSAGDPAEGGPPARPPVACLPRPAPTCPARPSSPPPPAGTTRRR